MSVSKSLVTAIVGLWNRVKGINSTLEEKRDKTDKNMPSQLFLQGANTSSEYVSVQFYKNDSSRAWIGLGGNNDNNLYLHSSSNNTRITLGSARIDVTKPVFYQDRPYITNQGPIQFEGNISVNVPTGQHPIFTMRRDGGNVAYVGFTNSGGC